MTKINVSGALKLTIARFINSAFVLLLVHNDEADWFEEGGLVYDANILLVCLAFSAPIIELIHFEGILKRLRMRWEMSKDDCKLT